MFLLLLVCPLTAQEEVGYDVAGNLRKHVQYLTSEPLGGRAAGSQGEKKAAEYFYDCLESAGVHMAVPRSGQDFFIVEGKDTLSSLNIFGIVDGYDPRLKGQYILVGANLDHLGINTLTVNGEKRASVYPGANDNASGLACIIEVARRVAQSSFMFPRSVVFAGFGAKEKGMAGSWYFVNKAFPFRDSISLMVDVREVGSYGPLNPFVYSTCIGNREIDGMIRDLPDAGAFFIPRKTDGVIPSGDYLAFYEYGIPVLLLTTGDNGISGTVNDVADALDYNTMDYICDFIYNMVREAANTEVMISGKHPSSEGQSEGQLQVPSGDRVYSPYEVEVAPKFFRGDERTFLSEWVYTYLKYPDEAVSQGISGTVMVEFIIEKDGTVTNVRAVSGNDRMLMDEAVKVISASPKWKPGQFGKEKVRVKYTLPVEFRLKKRK